MRYLTKEWYLAGQTWPVAADVQARLDETGRAFREARAREDLPPQRDEADLDAAAHPAGCSSRTEST